MKSLLATIILPALLVCNSSAAEVLIAGHSEARFAGGDVAFCKAKPENYFGFKNSAKGLSLIPANFEKRATAEGMSILDQDGPEEKPPTCWFLTNALEFPVLVSGFKVEGAPVLLKEFIGTLKPGEKKSLVVQNQKYSLTFPKVTGTNYECELGGPPQDLDGGGYQVIMAADFNNDGLPDFIVQNAPKYSFKQYQILMSDKATKKCKPVATQERYSC